MGSLKSVFGVIGALVPVVYCGGLLYYFLDTSGSVQGAATIGLGPTMLGLGVVGLLFCIPLIFKLVRFLGSGDRGGRAGSTPDGDDFDAEAALARYMARKSSGELDD